MRRPPLASGQFVAFRQVGSPGQAQVALYGFVAAGVFGDDLLHRLAIDADQAPRHHRVDRRSVGLEFVQAGTKGVLVGGQDIQCKVVGCIFWQLALPGIEQFAAQQGNQRHRQQDQTKRQGLTGCCQRLAQQLAQAQTPRQGGTGQPTAKALEAQQQQAAEYQCGNHAAAEQGEGQHQVQAHAPHDQAQCEQGGSVHRPGAGRDWQNVTAQNAQRRHTAQGGQWRQSETGQCNQPGAHAGQCGHHAAGRYIRREQVVQQSEQP